MHLRRVLLFALIVSLVLAACGAAEVLAPRLALKKAAAELGDDRRMSFTLSFSGNEQDAVAFFSEGEDEVTAEDLRGMRTLFNSRLRAAIDQGPDQDSPKDDSMALEVQIDKLERAVEIRQVDGTLYVRAAVRDLVARFGDPSEIDEMVAQGTSFGLDFLPRAVEGDWLALEIAPLESFLKGMAGSGGQSPTGLDTAGLDAGLLKGIRDAVAGAYGEDVDVKRLDADEVGDHYRLSASARRLYERLLPALRDLPMMQGIGAGDFPPASEIPDTKYDLDVWVKDGSISRVEFDLTQFSEAATRPGPVKLRVDISGRPDAITAPDGVTKIDVLELWGRFMGMAGAGFEAEGQPVR